MNEAISDELNSIVRLSTSALSPDGSILAYVGIGSDFVLRKHYCRDWLDRRSESIWSTGVHKSLELQKSFEVQILNVGRGKVANFQFSPSGLYIAVGFQNGILTFWPTNLCTPEAHTETRRWMVSAKELLESQDQVSQHFRIV